MLDIYFSNDNNDILKIPYVPYDFMINSSMNNETFETSEGYILTLKGVDGLRGFTLDSFFPHKIYSFFSSDTPLADTCINYFNDNKKENLRVVVADNQNTLINMLCVVNSFNYSKQQNKDVNYTLEVTEYIDPSEVV